MKIYIEDSSSSIDNYKSDILLEKENDCIVINGREKIDIDRLILVLKLFKESK